LTHDPGQVTARHQWRHDRQFHDLNRSYPKCQILVLCGHTHGGGKIQMLENLRVVTGAAEYGHPRIETILSVE
jgi:predicted MPP superfamily phosphohydrolase